MNPIAVSNMFMQKIPDEGERQQNMLRQIQMAEHVKQGVERNQLSQILAANPNNYAAAAKSAADYGLDPQSILSLRTLANADTDRALAAEDRARKQMADKVTYGTALQKLHKDAGFLTSETYAPWRDTARQLAKLAGVESNVPDEYNANYVARARATMEPLIKTLGEYDFVVGPDGKHTQLKKPAAPRAQRPVQVEQPDGSVVWMDPSKALGQPVGKVDNDPDWDPVKAAQTISKGVESDIASGVAQDPAEAVAHWTYLLDLSNNGVQLNEGETIEHPGTGEVIGMRKGRLFQVRPPTANPAAANPAAANPAATNPVIRKPPSALLNTDTPVSLTTDPLTVAARRALAVPGQIGGTIAGAMPNKLDSDMEKIKSVRANLEAEQGLTGEDITNINLLNSRSDAELIAAGMDAREIPGLRALPAKIEAARSRGR